MHYKNFKNATYAPAAYVQTTPLEGIRADIEKVGRYVKLDKIYLETYRSNVTVDRDKMEAVKALFVEYGYEVSGGVTTSVAGTLMGSMCYTDPEIRALLGDVAAFTAELFTEIMIDDFYFTNCRCERCIEAKGEDSWSKFRCALTNDISENVFIKRAKAARPDVHIIIKYPNWYESFPACGYNLEDGPPMYDSVYTGTETRDPHYTHQNLQRYLSYFLPRLLERTKPGLNGGGWFDLFECGLEDYLQQAYLTMFAKCRENMLFCLPLMTHFPAAYIAAVGATYDEADPLMGELGEPVGIACYRPHHAQFERHLYDHIGMLGIPLDPYPYYPAAAKCVFLTASAAQDGEIVAKIKQTLRAGGKVFLTGGLYALLADRGIADILPLEITDRKVAVEMFCNPGFGKNNTSYAIAEGTVTMPHIAYNTNDYWVIAAAQSPYASHPFIVMGSYGAGTMYVVNTPDNFADLYLLPAETLTLLRNEMDLPVTLESRGRVGLFLYDNDTFIIQSFLTRADTIRFRIDREDADVTKLAGPPLVNVGRSSEGETVYEVTLLPGRHAAFRVG